MVNVSPRVQHPFPKRCSTTVDDLLPIIGLAETHNETGLLAGYVEATLDMLRREGLLARYGTNLLEWAAIVREGPGNAGVNPTFDPAQTGSHDPAFWLEIRSGDEVVSVAASRLIQCDRYYPYVAAGRLWSSSQSRPVNILVDELGPHGPMAHTGGLWVHPKARGTGLSWVTPRLNQALAQLLWGVDDACSVIFASVHDAGLPAIYGAARCLLLIDGHFWPTGNQERIYSAEYPGRHMISRADNDLHLMHQHRDKKMSDLAAIARQWQREATVGGSTPSASVRDVNQIRLRPALDASILARTEIP